MSGLKGGERDISDIQQRLQSQINELVDRLTGVREIKRQYLTMGLIAGILIGLVIGVMMGLLMQSISDGEKAT